MHLSRLTVCQPDFLDLDPLPINLVFEIIACEQAGSRDFAFVGDVEISSLRLQFTITVRYSHNRLVLERVKEGEGDRQGR